ncbi:MAG: TonB-dependent receptor [Rhodanobacteraceae bacterium]|nr:TonB-dependent receptor [Rhodanobacteraceae bacterium]MBL0042522.1 TonB-dependent receptor [Xanthomonadales bacterium]MBP6077232.1 TonB-dependent receptor [Xanthomonadales bacterium]MBP7622756.1 TonB-dependent receptor [Xanthomonadales bacterium]
MTRRSASVLRPLSLRDGATSGARLLALGISAALIAGPAIAEDGASDDEESVELDVLRVEDRAADSNPYAEKNAPYKAKVSGDRRRTQDIADTPATIGIITRTQIKESGQSDLRDIVGAQPGITIGTGENGNAFGDRYVIRGQEARSDVFIDGLRDPGMTVRETFAVEQVEISKGPNSTYAGRGASGGTINSITKQATGDYDFHELEAAVGTDAYRRVTLDSNLPLGERVALRANLLHAFEEVPDRNASERERDGAALSLHVNATDHVSVSGDYYYLDAAGAADLGTYIVPGGGRPVADLPVYQQDEDFLESRVGIGTLRVAAGFGDWRVENAMRSGDTENGYVLTGARGGARNANDPQAPSAATITLSTHQGWQEVDYFADQLNAFWEGELGGLHHDLVIGTEYTDHGVLNGNYVVTNNGTRNCLTGAGAGTPNFCMLGADGQPVANLGALMDRSIVRGAYDADYAIDTWSLYALDTVNFGERWHLTVGLRWDDFDYRNQLRSNAGVETVYAYSDSLWNGNAGLVHDLSDIGNVYLSYATASDINGGESDVGGSCGYGGLCGTADQVVLSQPESVENIEVGTKWNLFDERLLLSAAAFQITKDDVMESVGNAYETLGTLNTGKNRVRGVEFGAVGNLTDKLSGQFAASVMDAEVLEAFTANQIGKTLSNFADRSAHAQLRYQLTPKLAIGGGATYSSEMYAGQPDTAAGFDANTGEYSYRVPSYTTFDAFASYAINSSLVARLNIGNLFDKDYYLAAYRSGAFTYIGDARSAQLSFSAGF